MDKQIEINLLSNFETKLKLQDKNFTFQKFLLKLPKILKLFFQKK